MDAALAIEAYLAGFRQVLDVMEHGGDNHGEMVSKILASVGLEPGEPWCCATVSYVGHRAFMAFDPHTLARTSRWPLVMTGGCQQLADDAHRKGVLVDTPQRGDLFVEWFEHYGRFAHTGVIDQVFADGAVTIEGNTNPKPHERNGFGCFVKHRTFGPKDRFIRWAQLLT